MAGMGRLLTHGPWQPRGYSGHYVRCSACSNTIQSRNLPALWPNLHAAPLARNDRASELAACGLTQLPYDAKRMRCLGDQFPKCAGILVGAMSHRGAYDRKTSLSSSLRKKPSRPILAHAENSCSSRCPPKSAPRETPARKWRSLKCRSGAVQSSGSIRRCRRCAAR